ncbi:hypothetical protein SCLCIDRAFT_24144 [Scleroderma citrinum Foug A]|uniref:Uncharacterized protein n=1 Tax=Scleroderma citrinum Foug A TaxID=1036808 RepID=A0A0C3AES9_9AGAM|nr:hypothetical protein SCLCIDRAFT_24144 [Scleroderma citrinum Foug A]
MSELMGKLIKHTNNPWNSATHDPPNPTNTVFIPELEVKAMELFIEGQRPSSSNQHSSLTQNQLKEDNFEKGMRVPTSVLNGCGDSFHAADEK